MPNIHADEPRRNHESRPARGRKLPVLAGVSLLLAFLVGAATAGERSAADLASDPQWLIFVAQDESSTEDLVGRYLSLRGMYFSREYLDAESTDLILKIPFSLDASPDIEVVVDTDTSARDASGERTVERRFIFRILFELAAPPEDDDERLALLEYSNHFMDTSWAPDRVYLYDDHILIFESSLNIPHEDVPIHGEMVYDVCARMAGGFNNYYKDAPYQILRMLGSGND